MENDDGKTDEKTYRILVVDDEEEVLRALNVPLVPPCSSQLM
ncbi:MAG: hypothetical protein QGH39_11785 [Candidatus Thermoplasmatota archaeon]|jgi:hypothetical protein|nr:hypothetical protein [Candidatus Thermoplasmatota archaeon]MDP7266226.1 hypothetical protein [Candidatus Thermoplasmatota archaeon]